MITYWKQLLYLQRKNINGGRRGFRVLCRKVALISPAPMSKCQYRSTLAQVFYSQTFGILCVSDQSNPFNHTSPSECFLFQLLQHNQRLCSSSHLKESSLDSCLKKWGDVIFFFQLPKQQRLPAIKIRGDEMEVTG